LCDAILRKAGLKREHPPDHPVVRGFSLGGYRKTGLGEGTAYVEQFLDNVVSQRKQDFPAVERNREKQQHAGDDHKIKGRSRIIGVSAGSRR
jgi:hypothetical protein